MVQWSAHCKSIPVGSSFEDDESQEKSEKVKIKVKDGIDKMVGLPLRILKGSYVEPIKSFVAPLA